MWDDSDTAGRDGTVGGVLGRFDGASLVAEAYGILHCCPPLRPTGFGFLVVGRQNLASINQHTHIIVCSLNHVRQYHH